MERAARWIGTIGFVASAFLYVGAPLVAPTWGVVLLWILWLALALTIPRVWDQPRLVLAAPIASVAVWVAVVLIGERLFGWTA